MADDTDLLRPTAGQYRQRAKFVRQKAEAMTNPEMCWLLREIAAEYEELADRDGMDMQPVIPGSSQTNRD